jgi:hypothetical protein
MLHLNGFVASYRVSGVHRVQYSGSRDFKILLSTLIFGEPMIVSYLTLRNPLIQIQQDVKECCKTKQPKVTRDDMSSMAYDCPHVGLTAPSLASETCHPSPQVANPTARVVNGIVPTLPEKEVCLSSFLILPSHNYFKFRRVNGAVSRKGFGTGRFLLSNLSVLSKLQGVFT